jgi:hypothetical protein
MAAELLLEARPLDRNYRPNDRRRRRFRLLGKLHSPKPVGLLDLCSLAVLLFSRRVFGRVIATIAATVDTAPFFALERDLLAGLAAQLGITLGCATGTTPTERPNKTTPGRMPVANLGTAHRGPATRGAIVIAAGTAPTQRDFVTFQAHV